MNWHEFVFSEKIKPKVTRHLSFWSVWWLYFFVIGIVLPAYLPGSREKAYFSPGTMDFIKVSLILFIQALCCYAVIYFLLPRTLLKARYFLFTAGIVFFGFAVTLATRFVSVTVIPLIETKFLIAALPAKKISTWWASISDGGINSIKITAAAIAIKLGKYWWRKQREKERFEKEKIEAELQLLKAQIHPDFLFNTLNNIYSFSLRTSPQAPEMLLKLSDILSYMLYECIDPEVSLEKEIKMLKDYMTLEKMRYGDKIEMNFQVRGDIRNQKIAPLLLLRFLENSFSQCSNPMLEQPWINVDLQIQNHVLYLKLMNGKASNIAAANEEDNMSQVQKRIELLYPARHELRIIEEPDIMIVNLRLELSAPHDAQMTWDADRSDSLMQPYLIQ